MLLLRSDTAKHKCVSDPCLVLLLLKSDIAKHKCVSDPYLVMPLLKSDTGKRKCVFDGQLVKEIFLPSTEQSNLCKITLPQISGCYALLFVVHGLYSFGFPMRVSRRRPYVKTLPLLVGRAPLSVCGCLLLLWETAKHDIYVLLQFA